MAAAVVAAAALSGIASVLGALIAARQAQVKRALNGHQVAIQELAELLRGELRQHPDSSRSATGGLPPPRAEPQWTPGGPFDERNR